MLQLNTKIIISDNSGIYRGKVIKNLNKKQFSKNGDFIVFSAIKKNRFKKNLNAKVYRGLIMSSRKKFGRKDNTSLKFDKNRICVVTKENKYFANYIKGPCSFEHLKGRKLKDYYKVFSNFETFL